MAVCWGLCAENRKITQIPVIEHNLPLEHVPKEHGFIPCVMGSSSQSTVSGIAGQVSDWLSDFLNYNIFQCGWELVLTPRVLTITW